MWVSGFGIQGTRDTYVSSQITVMHHQTDLGRSLQAPKPETRNPQWHSQCVTSPVPESLLIGLTALQTHKRAMEVTSHNLANATTPGFSRQRAELTAPVPEDSNPGQIGRGVDVDAIRRIVDTLTDERLRASSSETGRLKTLRDNLKTIELVFNEPGENGLSGVTNSLFNVLGDLSNNPESSALRSAAVQELQTWTSTLNDLSTRLDRLKQDVRSSIEDQLRGVNQVAEQIANLNQQIRRQTLSGNSPNDLLDARDKLINELSGYLELRVRRNAGDGSALIDAGGIQLVGLDSSNPLRAEIRDGGGVQIMTPNGGILKPKGGSIAALDELDRNIIPGVVGSLDGLAATVAKRLNALHATGTSQAMNATSFQAAFTVPTNGLQLNLDDTQLAQIDGEGAGIPPLFAASFTDAAGNTVARNLTINVRDTVTGEARKYTVHYDPLSGTGSRSMQDLVSAINTGTGGGFAVEPTNAIGIPGVRAKAVAVEGGWQFQLSAGTNQAIDFSPALDQRPTNTQWSGPQVTVSTVAAIPLAVGDRIQFDVERIVPGGAALQLRLSTRNAADGSTVSLGTVALAGAPAIVPVPGIGGSGQLNVDLGAGTYREGDRFVVDLNVGGVVLQKDSAVSGPYVQPNEHVATDAGFAVRGRYSGSLSLGDNQTGTPPFTTWSMRVVTAGTIGAKTSSDPLAAQPPVVEFSYWGGTSASPTQQTVRKILDETLPAGTPVQIADGVYAVFDAGDLTLTDPGEDATFTVDAEPDQAGILSALGIGGMFTGSTAATLRVAQRLASDPTQLNTGLTRAEGDNSNVLRLIGARNEKLYNNGAFTLDDTYSSILSDVGVRINQAERLNDNQSTIKAALENQRQQVSGVNIDEEVGMMILQQQAYTAAARVITFARENIQTLLDLAR